MSSSKLHESKFSYRYFKIGIEELELPANLLNIIKPLQNIGELQTRFKLDADPLRNLLERVDEDVEALQNQIRASLALFELTISEPKAASIEETVNTGIVEETESEKLVEVKRISEIDDQSLETLQETVKPEEEVELLEEIIDDLNVEQQLAEEQQGDTTVDRPQHLQGTARKFITPAAEVHETIEELDFESDELEREHERSQKRDRQQRRQ